VQRLIDYGDAIVNEASVRLGEQRRRRTYRSSNRETRARLTRRRVLEAATSVFLERGYAGATMRAIADEAGVSVPFVELLFGTKARVLKAAIDVAIAGDDEPIPVLDRGWAAEAVQADTVEEFLAIVASVIRAAQERSAGLVLAVFEGSRTDPELAALSTQLTAQRSATAQWLVEALEARTPLRRECAAQDAVETLWILMDPAVFDRLIRYRHWTPEQYQSWFAQSTCRLLITDAA
jgi:AcrR family transcriptional regulator